MTMNGNAIVIAWPMPVVSENKKMKMVQILNDSLDTSEDLGLYIENLSV